MDTNRMSPPRSPTQADHRQWVLDALDQYESRLLRYTQRLTGCLDDARDIVQFAFLRLCDQSPTEIDDRLAQWLYTVCRNRALDVLRSSERCRERPPRRSDSVGWDKAAAAAGPPAVSYSREHDPADLAEQSDLHALLRQLIEQSPRSQREAIDLWSDGFSYLQISEITSQTEGHIRVLVHRGLKAIRDHPQVRVIMEEDEDESERPGHRREQVCRH